MVFFGLSKRFGLVFVDFQTLERVPKDRYYWYQKVVRKWVDRSLKVY
ncbi:family 1 glycosylhydrolase [Paenibacillus sediminis]|nr:family 1 glycosylhydrolase [Paenibacillus sediminis]